MKTTTESIDAFQKKWAAFKVKSDTPSYKTAITGFLIRRHLKDIIRINADFQYLSAKRIAETLHGLGATDTTREGDVIVTEDTVFGAIGFPGWELPAILKRNVAYFELQYVDASKEEKIARTLYNFITHNVKFTYA